jgi:hypothetical protein
MALCLESSGQHDLVAQVDRMRHGARAGNALLASGITVIRQYSNTSCQARACIPMTPMQNAHAQMS